MDYDRYSNRPTWLMAKAMLPNSDWDGMAEAVLDDLEDFDFEEQVEALAELIKEDVHDGAANLVSIPQQVRDFYFDSLWRVQWDELAETVLEDVTSERLY